MVEHECPQCGSDLDFYGGFANCPNDGCEYQKPYKDDTFEKGETVTIKDTGEKVTINGSSYSSKMNRITYSVKENPGFFYFEGDFEKNIHE